MNPFVFFVGVSAILLIIILFLFGRIRERMRIARELVQLIDQDRFEYTILDVRGEEEYARGHIPHARNIPLTDMGNYLPIENMFEKIYVYGPNRRVSNKVAKRLSREGYFRTISFGAFRHWRRPIEKGGLKKD